MATFSAANQKIKGVADVIFLLDATGSMGSCINDVKDNIARFIDSLKNPEDVQEVMPVKDLRVAIYGYRDYGADGKDKWFITNPFTREPNEVRKQLDALKAEGGGDEPEDLLDALKKVAEIGSSDKNVEDPYKWRYSSNAARCVVVFTDATFHGWNNGDSDFVRGLASDSHLTGEDVTTALLQNKIRLSIFAPDFCKLGWAGYEMFQVKVDGSEYTAVPVVDDDPQKSLADFTGDRENFKKTLAQLAKSVSASSGAVLLEADEMMESEMESRRKSEEDDFELPSSEESKDDDSKVDIPLES